MFVFYVYRLVLVQRFYIFFMCRTFTYSKFDRKTSFCVDVWTFFYLVWILVVYVWTDLLTFEMLNKNCVFWKGNFSKSACWNMFKTFEWIVTHVADAYSTYSEWIHTPLFSFIKHSTHSTFGLMYQKMLNKLTCYIY